MRGVGKPALIAVVTVAGLVLQAQAAMMGETSFIGYHSDNSRWSHTAGSDRGHIAWRGSQPEWSAVNIGWVKAHTSPEFAVMPNSDPNSFDSRVASPIPPWKQESGTPVYWGTVTGGDWGTTGGAGGISIYYWRPTDGVGGVNTVGYRYSDAVSISIDVNHLGTTTIGQSGTTVGGSGVILAALPEPTVGLVAVGMGTLVLGRRKVGRKRTESEPRSSPRLIVPAGG